tara:strand:- start:97 stop:444 length:348 start_codon:yes stop_codon:yes gene_type:complete
MARPVTCGLDLGGGSGSGTAVASGSATTIHSVAAQVPGKQRGERLHIDLVNGGASATDVTISIGLPSPLVFVVSVPAKTLEKLDFWVEAGSTPILVTANAAATGVFAIGWQEHWT